MSNIDIYNFMVRLLIYIDNNISNESVIVNKSKLGKEAIFNKEISKGIVLRIVNDGTYSIGGNATKEQKENYINELKEITNDSRFRAWEVKDFIYTIIDAIEESIENSTRNDGIKDGTYGILDMSEQEILEELEQDMKKVPNKENKDDKFPKGRPSIVFNAIKGTYHTGW